VAAGSAASPPPPGPEPSPMDVEEACCGAGRRRRRRPPLSGCQWTWTRRWRRFVTKLGGVAAVARPRGGSRAVEDVAGGGRGSGLGRVAAVASPRDGGGGGGHQLCAGLSAGSAASPLCPASYSAVRWRKEVAAAMVAFFAASSLSPGPQSTAVQVDLAARSPPLFSAFLSLFSFCFLSLFCLHKVLSRWPRLPAGHHSLWNVTIVGPPPRLEPATAIASSTTPHVLPGSPPPTSPVERTGRAPTVMRPSIPMTVLIQRN